MIFPKVKFSEDPREAARTMLRPAEEAPLMGAIPLVARRDRASLRVAIAAVVLALTLVALVGSGMMTPRTELLSSRTSKLTPAEAAGLGGEADAVAEDSVAGDEEDAPVIGEGLSPLILSYPPSPALCVCSLHLPRGGWNPMGLCHAAFHMER